MHPTPGAPHPANTQKLNYPTHRGGDIPGHLQPRNNHQPARPPARPSLAFPPTLCQCPDEDPLTRKHTQPVHLLSLSHLPSDTPFLPGPCQFYRNSVPSAPLLPPPYFCKAPACQLHWQPHHFSSTFSSRTSARPPLIYSTGNPIDALDRLHEDMVVQYRALSVALGEPARTDLTDPVPGIGYGHLYSGAPGGVPPGGSSYGGGLGGPGIDAALGLGCGYGYGHGGRAALTLGGHGYGGGSSWGALAAAEPDSLAAARAGRGYHSGLVRAMRVPFDSAVTLRGSASCHPTRQRPCRGLLHAT